MEIKAMAINKNLTKNYTYSQARGTEYPTLKEQLDLLWHAIDDGVFGDSAKLTSFYTQLKAVKDKFPKS
jgi:predicted 3-demethylubiquinone-9 3-methyltransferase (glyoxalase superfamily)